MVAEKMRHKRTRQGREIGMKRGMPFTGESVEL